MSDNLTLLTCVNEKYLFFVEPFIYFAKRSNPGCYFEIYVPNPEKMKEEVNVTYHKLPDGHPATLRFLVEPPSLKTKYVYITDVDIMMTEEILPFHVRNLKGRTFSNIRRANKKLPRLGGLHFVDATTWYPDTRKVRSTLNPKGQDENILYQVVSSCYPTVPIDRGLATRPVHGIHCSPGRKIFGYPGWEATSQRIDYFFDTIEEANTSFNQQFESKVITPLRRACNRTQ